MVFVVVVSIGKWSQSVWYTNLGYCKVLHTYVISSGDVCWFIVLDTQVGVSVFSVMCLELLMILEIIVHL